MKQQRSINNNTDAYLKFLKPGALARLRDSRIRFTTKTSLPLLDLVQSSSATNDVMQVNLVNDEIPNFVTTTTTKVNNNIRYGPRCPQRKKLVANKAMMMMFINSETAAVVAAAAGSDNSNSNFVAAH
ncbi:hypothetical protein ACFE04_030560 [Oxalis oulophora]